MSKQSTGLGLWASGAGLALAAGAACHLAWNCTVHAIVVHGDDAKDALPKSPAGALVAEFLAAVNDGGDAKVEAFETKRRSAARSSATPLAERVARLKNVGAELGPIKFVRVVDQSDTSISIAAEGKGGQALLLEFGLDATAKDRFDGVSIEVGGGATPKALTSQERAKAVESAAKALEEGYVFPETGKKMAELARTKLKDGKYDSAANDAVLARMLTDDFRSISKDLHLGVRRMAPTPGHAAPVMGAMPPNHGFSKLEILPGNIGYVKFDFFEESPEANKTAAAAIAFVCHSDAIIFDMRTNGGGSPEMIKFITSYLFETPTHLNDMVDRDGKVVEEYWTEREVSGERIPSTVPIYVLTSSKTFSGAEEFTYNLKNLKRATVVGETTGGGAHPVRGERVSDSLVLRVPFMRARNPVSGTNWEGKGVEPDVKTPAGEALEKATALAKETLKARGSTAK